jgi:hypothetical protein
MSKEYKSLIQSMPLDRTDPFKYLIHSQAAVHGGTQPKAPQKAQPDRHKDAKLKKETHHQRGIQSSQLRKQSPGAANFSTESIE